jgi:hypothetical protein
LAASHRPAGPPPDWKQRKFAGNGPATSSEKSTFSPIWALLVYWAPPASVMAAVGLERSIVVWARRPRALPAVHEFQPSGKNSGSLVNE